MICNNVMMNDVGSSSFCSFMTENVRPVELQLPITREDLHEFSLSSVPKERTFKTLKQVYSMQSSYSVSVVPSIVVHLVGGLILTYIALIFLVLSLFNLIFFLIMAGLAIKFVRWSARNVRGVRDKTARKAITKLLERENR